MDWNPSACRLYQDPTRSHPSWVCGLKLYVILITFRLIRHTLRGCVDWNLIPLTEPCDKPSHTLRGCVDWNDLCKHSKTPDDGHTLRGCVDWNRKWLLNINLKFASHPSWVCGLKLPSSFILVAIASVTPFVGVWIETLTNLLMVASSWGHTLRGCVDWNRIRVKILDNSSRSHPSWVCGLKLFDWHQYIRPSWVTPFVGVWIETIV